MEKRIEAHLRRLKSYHPETYEHSLRVAGFCKRLARVNDLDSEDVKLVYDSGLLHDIGKLNVPIEIFTKPAALGEEEKEIVVRHVRDGFEMLEGYFFRNIRDVIVSHHEFCRNPYPRSGQDRRNEARETERRKMSDRGFVLGQMLAVCDMYDALSMGRAYKPSLKKSDVEKTLGEDFTGGSLLISQVMEFS